MKDDVVAKVINLIMNEVITTKKPLEQILYDLVEIQEEIEVYIEDVEHDIEEKEQ